jgi:hypothetical protein
MSFSCSTPQHLCWLQCTVLPFLKPLDIASVVPNPFCPCSLLLQRVRAACTRLGVERLPLLQLHWEDFRYPGYIEVAQRLVELQKGGLIQHFGVANFDVPHLVRLAEAGITPVTNQVGPGVWVWVCGCGCVQGAGGGESGGGDRT